jgi:hypothetical protein
MNAYDTRSAELLKQTVEVLGDTDAARKLIQSAYDLGRIDGGHEQIALQLVKFQEAAA